MTNSKTGDSIDVADIGGLYWLHLYDHNCIVKSGALMIEVGKDGAITGKWQLSWDNGDKVQGKYDVDTGSAVLYFGHPDSGYSLWGPVTENPEPGPNEKKLAIAGHWSYSGFGGTEQWGAFYAQQMKDTAQQMKAFQRG